MKCRKLAVGAILAAITPWIVAAPLASAADTLVVDDDGQQCGAEAFPTIAAALEKAVDGDTIRVCPGQYDGGIHVAESVNIVGPLPAMTPQECVDTAPEELYDPDLTQVAVIEPSVPTTELDVPLVTLAADDVGFSGLVLRGAIDATAALIDGYAVYTPALGTDDGFSGYQIHSNLIRGNTLGVELGSSGTKASRVHHNCLRENTWGLANQRETLTKAVIETNTTHKTRTLAYEIGWGLAGTELVTVRDNTSTEDGITLHVENAASTLVVDNTVTTPGVRAFGVLGGNAHVQIRDNVVTGKTGTGTTHRGSPSSSEPGCRNAAPGSSSVPMRSPI